MPCRRLAPIPEHRSLEPSLEMRYLELSLEPSLEMCYLELDLLTTQVGSLQLPGQINRGYRGSGQEGFKN